MSDAARLGTESGQNVAVWTGHHLIRDREAPGSNPGPPTKPQADDGLVKTLGGM